MKVLKDSKSIFVRLIDYKKNDFALEHYNVLKKNKKVWMLKFGKPIKESFIEEVIKTKGYLITKSTARNGSQFYICKIEKIDETENYIYPDYYNEIFKENSYELNEIKNIGYWIKIIDMKPIPKEIVEQFVTISTKRSLYECGTKFNQVSQIHVEALKDFEI